MPCKHFEDALIETAASGAEPQGDLRAHLSACTECRAAFEQERSLFASIDAGLHVTANPEVPAFLLPRVRARLDAQSVARRSWIPAWAVFAAASVLVLTVVSVRNGRHDTSGQNSQSNAVTQAGLPAVTPALPLGPKPQTNTRQRGNRRRFPFGDQMPASIDQVHVLLPPGQKLLIDAWLEGLQRGKVQARDLLAQNSDLPLQNLRISPLDVSPIEMKPLGDVSEASPLQNGEARR